MQNPIVKWFIRQFGGIPIFRMLFSRLTIWLVMRGAKIRPYPLSLWSPEPKIGPNDGPQQPRGANRIPYTAWPGLVDRTYTGRHLPPAGSSFADHLPPEEAVLPLLIRKTFIPAARTSALFPFFAQWFTDSFLRTDFYDRRFNTSNHEIDLCQVYGLDEPTAALLRAGIDGRLRSEEIGGEIFGERLYEPDGVGGLRVKPHFDALPYAGRLDELLPDFAKSRERKERYFASGLDRGNSTIGYTALNTVFLREHNRLCAEMKAAHPYWDDDQIFHTARNVNITLLLKIIVEDYVNHLKDSPFNLMFEFGYADQQRWYRTNRIALEFDLLYRWHGLVPETLEYGGAVRQPEEFRYNNALLERHGIGAFFTAASGQPAGRIGLQNTPEFLRAAEVASLRMARQFNIAPYNDYREWFGLKRAGSFLELTEDAEMAGKLEAVYGDIDGLEFTVGLLAEKRESTAVLGDLMLKMVAVDAFSQALTNPLLATNVFARPTFSEVGWRAIETTSRLQDVVRRNLGSQPAHSATVASFDR